MPRMLASEMPSHLGLHKRGRSQPLAGNRVGVVASALFGLSPSMLTRLLTGEMASRLRLHAHHRR